MFNPKNMNLWNCRTRSVKSKWTLNASVVMKRYCGRAGTQNQIRVDECAAVHWNVAIINARKCATRWMTKHRWRFVQYKCSLSMTISFYWFLNYIAYSKTNRVMNVWKCAAYQGQLRAVFIRANEDVTQNHADNVQLQQRSHATAPSRRCISSAMICTRKMKITPNSKPIERNCSAVAIDALKMLVFWSKTEIKTIHDSNSINCMNFMTLISFFSSHVVIAVRMFVIRAVVWMKNHAERNWKSIANVKIEKSKRHATRFGLDLRWSVMKRAPADRTS